VGSITTAGYLFGNLPWVKEHPSHIIWTMLAIPGVLILFSAWKARSVQGQAAIT
jgi:membrane-associated protein